MKPSEKPFDRIDQFFKNKLDDHTIAPSENAWSRVEAGLSKKNNVVLWRWAAAVLLMGALISVGYWSLKEDSNERLFTQKETPASKESAKALKKSNEPQEQPVKNDLAAKKPAQYDLKLQHGNRTVKKPGNIEQKESLAEEKTSNGKKNILETETALAQQNIVKLNRIEDHQEVVNQEKIKTEATTKTEVASSKQKPIKLEFTLDALPSEETVATTNETKATGLKKVLNLAREMKQGEGPVVESLREKKNELFANNFITRKERNQ